MMSHFPPAPSWRHEQFEIARSKAERESAVFAAINGKLARDAREMLERQEAERDELRRGRAEIVAHLSKPGATDAMRAARARFSVPEIGPDDPLPDEIVWAPAGVHRVIDSRTGKEVLDVVDAAAADAVAASFAEAVRKGARPKIDLEHHNGARAADVLAFRWDPARGIIAAVRWTEIGEAALRQKLFASFSPTYETDPATGRILGLAPGYEAGSLTNRPGFRDAMPPVLSRRGRSAAAELVRETMIAAGHSPEEADAVADAIGSGADGSAVAQFLRTICG